MKKEEIELLKNKINEIRNDYKLIDKNSLQGLTELQKLNEFLLQNYQCNSIYDKCKKQICISFRNIKTKEFYNKYFDCSSIAPKRKTTCPLSYLIYKLNDLADYEIFIACNILQSRAEQSRQQYNFRFSNILYVDIDVVKGSETLDINSADYNKNLLRLLYENYPIIATITPSKIIGSGSGVHLYFDIDTVEFNNVTRLKYHDILYRLTYVFDGDFNCVDVARILRPPYTYNRKEKFNNPKKVEILESNSKRYKLYELEQLLNVYDLKNVQQIPEGFIEIENCFEFPFSENDNNNFDNLKGKVDDTIFIDEDDLLNDEEIITDNWKIEILSDENTTIHKKQKKADNIFNLTDYKQNDDFPNNYLVQDLLFYIQNRNGFCIGARRNILFCFYFAFRQYCLMNEKNAVAYTMLINKMFKKPLPQSDLEYYFKYLSEYNLYRGIKNIKVANLLHFREEEIIYMRGIYTADMEEKRLIRQERAKERYRTNYKKKKPDRNTIITCIINNPLKTNVELADILHISTKTIQRIKKTL